MATNNTWRCNFDGNTASSIGGFAWTSTASASTASASTASASTATFWVDDKYCAVSECGQHCHKGSNLIPTSEPKYGQESIHCFCRECGYTEVNTQKLCNKDAKDYPHKSQHEQIIDYLYENYMQPRCLP